MRKLRLRIVSQGKAAPADQEKNLEAAEKRASTLFEKADLLHTVVTRRDQENHWQASVNKLFLGGT